MIEPTTGPQAPSGISGPTEAPLLEGARLLRVQPGDVVAITVDRRASEADLDDIHRRVKTLFPHNEVGLLRGVALTIIRPTEPPT